MPPHLPSIQTGALQSTSGSFSFLPPRLGCGVIPRTGPRQLPAISSAAGQWLCSRFPPGSSFYVLPERVAKSVAAPRCVKAHAETRAHTHTQLQPCAVPVPNEALFAKLRTGQQQKLRRSLERVGIGSKSLRTAPCDGGNFPSRAEAPRSESSSRGNPIRSLPAPSALEGGGQLKMLEGFGQRQGNRKNNTGPETMAFPLG